MDTTHGEPEYVNWPKSRWDLEEAMDAMVTVGAMINDDLQRLIENLPGTILTWSKQYKSLPEWEVFHHEVLALAERARNIGLSK